MRATNWFIALLMLLTLTQSGGLIVFGDMVRNIIFNSRKETIILFYSDQHQRSEKALFSNYGAKRKGEVLFSPLGSANP